MADPDWYYDDLRQVGLDFADEDEVARYDERQVGAATVERSRPTELGLRREHVIADIGCGTGLLACEAAKICASVHAIDVSAAMLAATARRAAGLGLENVALQRSGFLSFDLADGSLDLAVSQFALHHLPDFWKVVALTRIRKALKLRGRLYLRDVAFQCAPDAIPVAVEDWIVWMQANTGYARSEVACHVREEHSTFAWVMEEIIRRTGFCLISAEYSEGVYASYVAEKSS